LGDTYVMSDNRYYVKWLKEGCHFPAAR